MTPAPLWRRFLIFLLPMMATNILQSLSGTINNILLGQLLGVEALAAASVFFPVMFLFIAFLVGLSAGASVLIGQAHGAGHREQVKAISGTVLTVALLAGIVVAMVGASQAGAILRLLGTPENILDDALSFARASFLSLPFLFLFLISSSLLRGVGDTLTPFLIQIFATLISALATVTFIRGWFGLPQMGVASAALGGLVSFALSFVLLGFFLRWRRHPMAPDLALARRLRPDPRLLGLVLKVGVPTGVQVIAGALGGIVIIGLVNKFGSNATAAFGAVNQIVSYVQFPALSVGITTSIFGAQFIGAGRAGELGRVLKTAMIMNLTLTGGLVVLVYLLSRPVVMLFTTEPEVVELSQTLLHIVAWSSLMFGMGTIFSGIMRASGVVLVPMLLGIAAIVLVELPVAIFLARRIGITGIWWGYVANFAALMILQAAYYQFVWKKKRIRSMI